MKRIIFLVLILAMATSAQADRRKYAWTYQYALMPPGEAELEFYQTTRIDETDSWEYRIETEHGLSQNWDLSIYQIFAQREGESFRWDAFQVRARYRLAGPDEYYFNPLLYLEYRRKIDLEEQNKLEAKLILSRAYDRVDLSINPVYEFFWAPGEPVHEIGLDVGLSYEVNYHFSLGLESLTRHEFLKGEDDETGFYVGPTIGVASGGIYYTVGYLAGLTDDSNDARVRFLMGIDL